MIVALAPKVKIEEETLAETFIRFQEAVRSEYPNANRLEILIEPEVAVMKVKPPSIEKFGETLRDVTVEDCVRYVCGLLNLRCLTIREYDRIVIRK